MESIRELYRIGCGPSSSHTMGPQCAARQFRDQNPAAKRFRVTLYGSLAATGKGHLTDVATQQTLAPFQLDLVWEPDQVLPFHANGMRFEALDEADQPLAAWVVYSTGGGAILGEGEQEPPRQIYELTSMRDILKYCTQHDLPSLYRETAVGGLAKAYRFPPPDWFMLIISHGNGKGSVWKKNIWVCYKTSSRRLFLSTRISTN